MKLPKEINIVISPGRISNPDYLIKDFLSKKFPECETHMQEDGSFYFNDWPYYFGKHDSKVIENLKEQREGNIIHAEITLKAMQVG